jgi:hypothetical protein
MRSGAKHDTYVLAAQVLGVMGLLEAKLLVPGITPYSPERSFNAVRNEGSVPWETISALLDHIGAYPLHYLPPAPQAPLPAQPAG